jgi:hypothetical protein
LDIFDAPDFTIKLLGPTRLAKKYQVDWVLKQVASQLEKRWPTTLRGWDGIVDEEDEEESYIMFGPPLDGVDRTLGGRKFSEPVSSILLARLCDTPTILPLAFFNLLIWPSVFETKTDAHFASLKNVPRRDLISPEDLHRIFEARERIGKWVSAARQGHAWQQPCGSGMACRMTTSETWLSIAENSGHNGDFLRSSRQAERIVTQSRLICPGCKKSLEIQIRTHRWDFVDQLHEVFQLNEA